MCLTLAHCGDVGGVERKQHGAGGRMQGLLALPQGKLSDNFGGCEGDLASGLQAHLP